MIKNVQPRATVKYVGVQFLVHFGISYMKHMHATFGPTEFHFESNDHVKPSFFNFEHFINYVIMNVSNPAFGSLSFVRTGAKF